MYLCIIGGCRTVKILLMLGITLSMCGVILIYDARPITKKMFSFGDQNDATQRIKNIRIYCNNYWRINSIFCIEYFCSLKPLKY